MAHECPECGLLCHCGGDIDDLVFNDTPAEARCDHCWNRDDEIDDYADDGIELVERDERCQFPGHCLMPGPHLPIECCSVEMMEAFEQEQRAERRCLRNHAPDPVKPSAARRGSDGVDFSNHLKRQD